MKQFERFFESLSSYSLFLVDKAPNKFGVSNPTGDDNLAVKLYPFDVQQLSDESNCVDCDFSQNCWILRKEFEICSTDTITILVGSDDK